MADSVPSSGRGYKAGTGGQGGNQDFKQHSGTGTPSLRPEGDSHSLGGVALEFLKQQRNGWVTLPTKERSRVPPNIGPQIRQGKGSGVSTHM